MRKINIRFCVFLTAVVTLPLAAMFSGCGDSNGSGNDPWDNKHRLVNFGNYPVVSPDGAYIVFGGSDGDTSGIWLYEFDSGAIRLLTGAATISDYAWAPASDRIAYSNPAGGFEGGLWIADIEGNTTQLSDFGEYPNWSPDSSEIVFQGGSAGGIFKITASGGQPVPLYTAGFKPKWSPDGNDIAFYEELASVSSLQTIPSGGGTPVYLTAGGSDFDWSPDSDAIVFHRYESGAYGYTYNIKVVDLSNLNADVLWTGGTSPRWSPEGARIVFEGVSGSAADGIFIMDPYGGSVERISSSGSNPSFRLNQETVVYDRSNGVWVAYKN